MLLLLLLLQNKVPEQSTASASDSIAVANLRPFRHGPSLPFSRPAAYPFLLHDRSPRYTTSAPIPSPVFQPPNTSRPTLPSSALPSLSWVGSPVASSNLLYLSDSASCGRTFVGSGGNPGLQSSQRPSV